MMFYWSIRCVELEAELGLLDFEGPRQTAPEQAAHQESVSGRSGQPGMFGWGCCDAQFCRSAKHPASTALGAAGGAVGGKKEGALELCCFPNPFQGLTDSYLLRPRALHGHSCP